MSELTALLERVVEGAGFDMKLDHDLMWLMLKRDPAQFRERDGLRETNVSAGFGEEDWRPLGPYTFGTMPGPTVSIDAAVRIVERCLPGWWWKVGTCCVSDDACIAPDYNNPAHSERLHKQFPLDKMPPEFDGGFDVDRRPPGNVPRALLESLLLALIAIEQNSPAFNPR